MLRAGVRRWSGGGLAAGVALAAAWLAACATAPKASTTAAPAAAQVRPLGWGDDPADRAPGPVLFQVDAPGGKLDLFGTMHTQPLAAMPKLAADRYAAARVVAFEVDIGNLNPTKIFAAATLPADQSLDRMLGPEAWGKLVKHLDGTLQPRVLQRFRPWVVLALLVQKAGVEQPNGETMDGAMLKEGRAQKKSVRFLETVDEQMAVLDKTIDAAFLIKLIAELDGLPAAIKGLTDAYTAGDVSSVEAAMGGTGTSNALSGEQFQAIFGARNERWIPFLERLAAEGGAFVAVGAGHLIGKDGLVALLRARGYHVARVR